MYVHGAKRGGGGSRSTLLKLRSSAPRLFLVLLLRASALSLAAVRRIFRLRLNFKGVNCEKLGDPIAHDVMLLQTAVLAAVNLNHAAVVNLSADDASDLR